MIVERRVRRAIVRPPGESYKNAISSSGAAIDVKLARSQHQEYCQALLAAGLDVQTLPPDERYPDSCFMQDPALVVAGQGIVCRMAATSRQGEEVAAAAALASHGLPLARIVEPGTLEGGDVLILPGRLLVGLTARSNQTGVGQLASILEPLGLEVTGIPVSDYLHLLSAVTYVGQNLLLAVPAYARHPAFASLDVLVVPPAEAYAVNTLALGPHVVVPAGYPTVSRMLRERGFEVLETPTSEFAKADGGVTCLSLIW